MSAPRPDVSDTSTGPPLTFDLSVKIRRPPTTVFAFLVDVQDHEPIPTDAHVHMTKHPSSATHVGTRWDEKVRLAPGWWMSVRSVVTNIEEPGLLAMDFSTAWCTGHLTYTIHPAEEGSVVCQHEVLRPRLPVGRMALWVDRRLRAQLLKRLSDIRSQVESPAGISS